jgi:hypothetical protein
MESPRLKVKLFFSLKANVGLKTAMKYAWKLFPPNAFWKEFRLLTVESLVIDLAPPSCCSLETHCKVVPANTVCDDGALVGHMAFCPGGGCKDKCSASFSYH